MNRDIVVRKLKKAQIEEIVNKKITYDTVAKIEKEIPEFYENPKRFLCVSSVMRDYVYNKEVENRNSHDKSVAIEQCCVDIKNNNIETLDDYADVCRLLRDITVHSKELDDGINTDEMNKIIELLEECAVLFDDCYNSFTGC